MKNRKIFIAGIALCALFSFSAFINPVHGATQVTGATFTLHSISSFIDLLIAKGIITEENATRGRELAERIQKAEKEDEDSAKDSDMLEVSVSQYIEQGALTFNKFEAVQGLLLMVTNKSEEPMTLEAKRKCQVVYRIYNESDTLLYNSAEEKACKTTEKVTYVLGAGDTRIFPIRHVLNRYALQPGEYRFELEYPGYGKGDRTVTIR